ncbi:MAG: iron-sulfur cluster assembly scaffold protein [Thermoplasmata archaeon]|nr:iron-sulfur cluster assembly scaffold protein [Thermoplasmata archaeon]
MTRDRKKSDLDKFVEEVQKEIDRKEAETYSKRVIEEYRNPKNIGQMEDPDGAAKFKGPCGDTMEVYLKVEGGRIKYICFFTDGCGPSIACGSMLTQMARGRTLDGAADLSKEELIEVLGGLPDESLHCAELAVTTLRKALEDLGRDPS